MRTFNFSIFRLFSSAAIILGGIATGFGQHSEQGGQNSRFGPQTLRPMPDFRRVIDSEDVRKFWLQMIPQVNRPSQMSSGYQYAMPFYRKELAERNCLVDDLQRGVYDERAECEALKHNIRHHRRHGNAQKAEELKSVLTRREAVAAGDTNALNALLLANLLEAKTDSPEKLQELVILQSSRIADLENQIERLKNRLIRLEIAAAPIPPAVPRNP